MAFEWDLLKSNVLGLPFVKGRLQFHVSCSISVYRAETTPICTWSSSFSGQFWSVNELCFPQELRKKPCVNWKMMGRRNENSALEGFIACFEGGRYEVGKDLHMSCDINI